VIAVDRASFGDDSVDGFHPVRYLHRENLESSLPGALFTTAAALVNNAACRSLSRWWKPASLNGCSHASNLRSVFLASSWLTPVRGAGGGRLLTFHPSMPSQPRQHRAYAASKGGLLALTRQLRLSSPR